MRAFIITALALAAIGCNNAARPVPDGNAAATTPERSQTAIAHSSENQTPPAVNGGSKTKWTQSGDPIDTTALDAAIASAEAGVKKSPDDAVAKKALGDAYFKRGLELTQPARQYASALGDFRRALKYDPSNAQAKEWIDRIVSIYDSMNRQYPPEGEEPPPLPFKKDK